MSCENLGRARSGWFELYWGMNRASSPPTNSNITYYRSTKRKIGDKNSNHATNIDNTTKQF
jgi:hypothetical protein